MWFQLVQPHQPIYCFRNMSLSSQKMKNSKSHTCFLTLFSSSLPNSTTFFLQDVSNRRLWPRPRPRKIFPRVWLYVLYAAKNVLVTLVQKSAGWEQKKILFGQKLALVTNLFSIEHSHPFKFIASRIRPGINLHYIQASGTWLIVLLLQAHTRTTTTVHTEHW